MTLLGAASLPRKIWKCSRCRGEFAPLDERLGARGCLSGGAAEATLALLAELPHRVARGLVKKLCGVNASASTVQRLGEKVGPGLRRSLEAEEEALLAPVVPGRPVPPISAPPSEVVVREIDGVKVHVEGGWHDVKVGVSFALGPQGENGGRERVIEPAFCATRGDAERIGRETHALSLSQGIRKVALSQFLSDAGNWLPGLARGILKHSIWTLDYYHLSSHVAAALDAMLGKDTKASRREHGRLRRILLQKSGPARVLRSLRARKERSVLDAERARVVDNVASYIERHLPNTDYHALLARGLPIGSGAIEGGGCKRYIKARFGRSGMRWSGSGFDNVEAIRRVHLNDRPDILRSVLYSGN